MPQGLAEAVRSGGALAHSHRTGVRPPGLANVRVVGALAALSLAGLSTATPAAGQSWTTVQRSFSSRGAERFGIDMAYGAGRFAFRPGARGTLYQATLRYDAEVVLPELVFDREASSLSLEFDWTDRRVDWSSERYGSLELAVDPYVPTDVALALGAARAEIELGGLTLRSLLLSIGAADASVTVSEPLRESPGRARIETGAGELRLSGLANLALTELEVQTGVGRTVLGFGGAWEADLAVDIGLGLGAVEIQVPEGVGVRVRKSGLLLHLDGEDLDRVGDAWESPGFEEAERRLTVQVDGAVGQISVVRIPTGGGD